MIQMRWYSTDNKLETLQFRQLYDTTVYAGNPTPEQKLMYANYQWSEWTDVPKVKE